MVTVLRCWRLHHVDDLFLIFVTFSMWIIGHQHLKVVNNIQTISNIRRPYRCGHIDQTPLDSNWLERHLVKLKFLILKCFCYGDHSAFEIRNETDRVKMKVFARREFLVPKLYIRNTLFFDIVFNHKNNSKWFGSILKPLFIGQKFSCRIVSVLTEVQCSAAIFTFSRSRDTLLQIALP